MKHVFSSRGDNAMHHANFAEMYERWIVGPLFRPWAKMTLEEVNLDPRERVLDVACGTGIVARVARERLGGSGYIVGVDLSPEMLAVADTLTSFVALSRARGARRD